MKCRPAILEICGLILICGAITRAAVLLPPPSPLAAVPPRPRTVSVWFTWNTVTAVSRIYWGIAPRTYTNFIEVKGSSAQVTNLEPNVRYHFAATQIDALGAESGYSEELVWPSTVVRIFAQVSSSPDGPWTNFGPPLLQLTNPAAEAAFFRVTSPQLQSAADPLGLWTNIAAPLLYFRTVLTVQRQ